MFSLEMLTWVLFWAGADRIPSVSEAARGSSEGGVDFTFGSTPAPKTGLGSVDKFVELAEADAELPSSTICTSGSGGTLSREASSAGG